MPNIPTHPEVVDAIVAGLTAAGAPENNIIIYDNFRHKLTAAGYKYNAGDVGARCFGTDEKGWRHDVDNPVKILGQKIALSKIITHCDHLINVPVLKVHLDQYGVTLSLKNHYGSIGALELQRPNAPVPWKTLSTKVQVLYENLLAQLGSIT